MALFDDFSKKAARFTEKAIDKSGELADTAKTKLAMKSQQAELDDVYKELGQRYYQLLKDPDFSDDSSELVAKADAILEKIAELQSQLNN